jgi:hypothetical protein
MSNPVTVKTSSRGGEPRAIAPRRPAILLLYDPYFMARSVSTKEAATALGIAESALKVRLHRARLALRASLAGTNTDDLAGMEASLPEPVERRLLTQVCPTPRGSTPHDG